jgi:hypothetical protein
MQRQTSHAGLGLVVLLAALIVGCSGQSTAGRHGDQPADRPTASPVSVDPADPEAVLLGDELAPGELEALAVLGNELPPDPEISAPGLPATPAPTRGSGAGAGSNSTTEASQLLGQLDGLLRQLDSELAAFDVAANTLGE